MHVFSELSAQTGSERLRKERYLKIDVKQSDSPLYDEGELFPMHIQRRGSRSEELHSYSGQFFKILVAPLLFDELGQIGHDGDSGMDSGLKDLLNRPEGRSCGGKAACAIPFIG